VTHTLVCVFLVLCRARVAQCRSSKKPKAQPKAHTLKCVPLICYTFPGCLGINSADSLVFRSTQLAGPAAIEEASHSTQAVPEHATLRRVVLSSLHTWTQSPPDRFQPVVADQETTLLPAPLRRKHKQPARPGIALAQSRQHTPQGRAHWPIAGCR